MAPISLIGSPSRTSLCSSPCSCRQLFICSEGTWFSVSPEIVSPKKLHDLSKAPRQGARSEEITCPVYSAVSHTGDSHTAHFVSRNNLAAFQHRACPCCQAPCAISNYDVASISTLFSPGETGDLATAVLCCPDPPAGVQGMLAKGKHSKTAACDSFICVQPSQGALALCLAEDILPQIQQAYQCTEVRQTWDLHFSVFFQPRASPLVKKMSH